MIEFIDLTLARQLHLIALGYGPHSTFGTIKPETDGLLQSAINAPINAHAYAEVTDVITLAAMLCARVARNHCFVDGNKRTAFALMLYFLESNAISLGDYADEEMISAVEGLAASELSEEAFEAFIRRHCRV